MLRYTSILLLVFLSQIAFSQKTVIDKIVARAADNIIMLSDIQAQKLQALKEDMEVNDESDCFILEESLIQKLLIAKAAIDSVEVPEGQIEQELNTRVQRFVQMLGGREQMEEFYGMPVARIKEKFRGQIRDMLTARQMESTITASLGVTPKEIETFYNNLPLDSLPLINSQVSMSHLIIFPEVSKSDKAETRASLESYRKRILSGDMSFGTVAILKSEDPGSAKQSGDLGWATRGTMVPEFEEIAFSLAPGDISEVFESPFGMHIIQLIERRGDDYHCKHILFVPQVSPYVLQDLQKKMNEAYTRINSGEITFEEAIQEYSNDKNNKATNGMMMNPYTGDVKWDIQDLNQIDPEMSILVDQLSPGQITRPAQYMDMVQRKPGIRILRLNSVSKPHRANLKDDYKLIQEATLNQKKQERIDEWIGQTIGQIYVYVDADYKNCPFRYDWFNVIK